MQIYAPMIQHQAKIISAGKEIKGRPFQIFGFDLLIDHKLKAWILEVNDHPSLNIYFDTTFMQTKKMEEEDICPVDLYVKSRVVKDTILLAKSKSYVDLDQFESLTKIYPSENSDLSEVVVNLQQIFYAITKIKAKDKLSSQQFEKLAEKTFFSVLELRKVDLSLCF